RDLETPHARTAGKGAITPGRAENRTVPLTLGSGSRRCESGARQKRNEMNQEAARIRQEMKTPRAAAVAGILFSILAITSLLLFRVSITPSPLSQPTGMIRHSKTISLALYLLPFAGIAFLWFMGVIRHRLGESEDRFFATVFFGSGLLFVA